MTEDAQTDNSGERNRRQLSDAARMRTDLQAMMNARPAGNASWLFRSFVQDRQFVWFEPMARSLAARWHRSDAGRHLRDGRFSSRSQAWNLVERTVRNGSC